MEKYNGIRATCVSLDAKNGAWYVKLTTGDETGETRKVRPDNLQLVEDDRYVAKPKSGIVHIPLVWSIDFAPESWRTRCGWCFGLPLALFKAYVGKFALDVKLARCWQWHPHIEESDVEENEEDFVGRSSLRSAPSQGFA